MNLEQIKPTIDSRMRTLLQSRRVVPAPGQPLPTSTRVDDAADVCATTVEVVMEYAIGQLGHDDAWRRVEAERVASFLGWCWFPKLGVEPAELLGAMALETLRALRASAPEALWGQLAALELRRRDGGPAWSGKLTQAAS